MAQRFIRAAHLLDFHQEGFDDEFLHSSGLPENSLGVDVEMKVPRLDGTEGAGFFRSLTLGGLAVREAGLRGPFWEGPLFAPLRFSPPEFHPLAPPPHANPPHPQGPGLPYGRRTHPG